MAKPSASYSNTSMATVRKVSNCCHIDVKKSTVFREFGSVDRVKL